MCSPVLLTQTSITSPLLVNFGSIMISHGHNLEIIVGEGENQHIFNVNSQDVAYASPLWKNKLNELHWENKLNGVYRSRVLVFREEDPITFFFVLHVIHQQTHLLPRSPIAAEMCEIAGFAYKFHLENALRKWAHKWLRQRKIVRREGEEARSFVKISWVFGERDMYSFYVQQVLFHDKGSLDEESSSSHAAVEPSVPSTVSTFAACRPTTRNDDPRYYAKHQRKVLADTWDGILCILHEATRPDINESVCMAEKCSCYTGHEAWACIIKVTVQKELAELGLWPVPQNNLEIKVAIENLEQAFMHLKVLDTRHQQCWDASPECEQLEYIFKNFGSMIANEDLKRFGIPNRAAGPDDWGRNENEEGETEHEEVSDYCYGSTSSFANGSLYWEESTDYEADVEDESSVNVEEATDEEDSYDECDEDDELEFDSEFANRPGEHVEIYELEANEVKADKLLAFELYSNQ